MIYQYSCLYCKSAFARTEIKDCPNCGAAINKEQIQEILDRNREPQGWCSYSSAFVPAYSTYSSGRRDL